MVAFRQRIIDKGVESNELWNAMDICIPISWMLLVIENQIELHLEFLTLPNLHYLNFTKRKS